MEYLRDYGNPFIYTLNYNCRNTEQIALRTAALSLVPPAKKLKITEPKVVAKSYNDRNLLSKIVVSFSFFSFLPMVEKH